MLNLKLGVVHWRQQQQRLQVSPFCVPADIGCRWSPQTRPIADAHASVVILVAGKRRPRRVVGILDKAGGDRPNCFVLSRPR
jgi:hypothetical protein